jgi:hypothetical protein
MVYSMHGKPAGRRIRCRASTVSPFTAHKMMRLQIKVRIAIL